MGCWVAWRRRARAVVLDDPPQLVSTGAEPVAAGRLCSSMCLLWMEYHVCHVTTAGGTRVSEQCPHTQLTLTAGRRPLHSSLTMWLRGEQAP